MNLVMEEFFDVVNQGDQVIGRAARGEVHGNPLLLHRVVHVLVFNSRGLLFLQKRGRSKSVQPGKWDTSVGGHVLAGEGWEEALLRETEEELGIVSSDHRFLYSYIHRNEYESELVRTYRLLWDGPIKLQESEIDEGCFWDCKNIAAGDPDLFTPNLREELARYARVS